MSGSVEPQKGGGCITLIIMLFMGLIVFVGFRIDGEFTAKALQVIFYIGLIVGCYWAVARMT